MTQERFQELVSEAVDSIPDYFMSRVANLQVEVRPYAPPDLARELRHHPMGLLGVYQGVPFNRRGSWYGNVLPDRIILFQRPIEAQCRTVQQVRQLVRRVVIHEIGHYFGLTDRELRRLEREADAAEREAGGPSRPD